MAGGLRGKIEFVSLICLVHSRIHTHECATPPIIVGDIFIAILFMVAIHAHTYAIHCIIIYKYSHAAYSELTLPLVAAISSKQCSQVCSACMRMRTS